MSKPRRVLIAGTAFGRFYLDAIDADPKHFTLAGILSRGGEFSRELARQRNVPLHTTTDEIPGDIDLACVVVRSGATGGPGTELALSLLTRGIPVLQEHPVHAGEIAECLRAARRHGVPYAVETMYPQLQPVRQFLAAAEVLRDRVGLTYVDASANSQVLYPLLDILARLTATPRPWHFAEPAPAAAGYPFTEVQAVVGGTPVSLRIQNQVHPDDPDNHSYLFHRLAAGTPAGVLTLADTHGPVLWQPRLHSPRDHTGRLLTRGPGTHRLDVPSTSSLSARPGTFHEVFAELWPDALAHRMRQFCRLLDEPAGRAASGQWDLAVSTMWAQLTGRIGLPELIRPGEPPPVPMTDLEEAARAAA
ncbi:thiazolinyl imide reductase [Micromonospora sp. Llam0]|uniref:Gfo/Idh/MocA family oxidoreductase n=1 Tax=Micromonospora sp. Llam0 TaxID=2485143 RepID=UPI000F47D2E6|nr:Gfo/Idh/MocA family oxidoreductase [Micromonospora sp. Llam0]ROO60461.1 thiazolinyl imide reductase [Micromonospora sp. Llam0]